MVKKLKKQDYSYSAKELVTKVLNIAFKLSNDKFEFFDCVIRNSMIPMKVSMYSL